MALVTDTSSHSGGRRWRLLGSDEIIEEVAPPQDLTVSEVGATSSSDDDPIVVYEHCAIRCLNQQVRAVRNRAYDLKYAAVYWADQLPYHRYCEDITEAVLNLVVRQIY